MEEEAEEELSLYESHVKKLEKRLSKVLELAVEEQKLDSLEKAKLNVVLAKATNVLYAVHLRTRGVNTKGHPIEKELERIARFEEKIKRAVKESEASALAGEAALGFVADAPPKKDKKRDKAKRKRKQKE